MSGSKILLTFFLAFLLSGMLFNVSVVLAQDDEDRSGSNSGSDNDASVDVEAEATVTSGSNDDSDNGDEREERTETRVRDRTRERDGEVERETRVDIRNADGERVRIERKIRIRDGEVEIKTRLRVEGSGANFSVIDSDGEAHRIRVTPEKLRMLIMERLQASNITDFSFDEVEDKERNIPRVVFKVNSEHPGRFLGIFKIAMRAQTQVDPETGEVLDVNVPWWAFLITGEEIDEDELVGNETVEDDLVADDDELEDEFGDVEIEEELEIKAETLNGNSEIKIELEFETESADTERIIGEVLSKLTLTSEEINSLLEMEISDELLEVEEKIEFEIDSETDELTEAEFELRFFVESDIREVLIASVSERLSSLTSEDILNALEVNEDDDEETEQPEENQITLNLLEQSSSGESGTAVLEEDDGQVTVTLSMTGFQEDVSQPAHIHIGSCPDVGSIAYPLENVLNGNSETTLDLTFEQLESELPLGINVHKSVEEAGVWTACGDVVFE